MTEQVTELPAHTVSQGHPHDTLPFCETVIYVTLVIFVRLPFL